MKPIKSALTIVTTNHQRKAKTMILSSRATLLLFITITFQSQIPPSNSQQQYIDNLQLNCSNNDNRTKGFVCNGVHSTCTSYVTFLSTPPRYATSETIAALLNVNASDIAHFNNITESDLIPAGHLVVVPVSCSCTSSDGIRYYQHNTGYRLSEQGQTYFSVATDTYQQLTTCQAVMAHNSFQDTNLKVGEEFMVPLRCACPTAEQERKYDAQFLLYYQLQQGDFISHIADIFGVDTQSVLEANELTSDSTVYYTSPVLVPLKSAPANISLSLSPSVAPQTNPEITVTPGGSGGSSRKWVFVGVGIAAGISLLILLYMSWFFIFLALRKNPVSSTVPREKGANKDPELAQYDTLPGSYSSSDKNSKYSRSVTLDGLVGSIESLAVYKFEDLKKATGNFSEANRVMGSVFRGKFNGDEAAIKTLTGTVAIDEINLLKHINHSNIIGLSGYCFHEGNTYMVYEYAENGSLDDCLFLNQTQQFEETNKVPRPVLGWKQRVQIACNVADALNYLHSYVNPPYIHKNLKSSNIVLDSNYRAKITNFGLARTVQTRDENGEIELTKNVIGTYGYLAPEYIENGVLTTKLDVFAFGVVVLQLLSGKPAVILSEKNKNSENVLFGVIRKVFEGENVREELVGFMDAKLCGEYPMDLAYLMAQLTYNCVHKDINSRPSMLEVSMTLSRIYSSSLESYSSNL